MTHSELYKKLTYEIDEAITSLKRLRGSAINEHIDPKQIDRVARDVALMTSVMKDIAYEMAKEAGV